MQTNNNLYKKINNTTYEFSFKSNIDSKLIEKAVEFMRRQGNAFIMAIKETESLSKTK